MNQGKPAPRVSSGIPWWVWLMGILLTGGVILGILSSLNTDDPEDLFRQAAEAAEARQSEQVVGLIERLKAFPERRDLLDVMEGIAATGTNRDPRAIKLLKPHIEHENALARKLAVKYSAMAYQRTGQAVEAREMYKRAIELDPTDVEPRLLLATLYKSAGAYEPALAESRAVVEQDAENSSARELIAQMQMDLSQWSEAIATLSVMVNTDGKRATASPDVINRYLTCLLNADRVDEALAFFEANSALVSEPGVKLSVLTAAGEITRAEDALKELTMGAMDTPMHIRIAAQAAIEEEDWDKAIGLLREFLQASPRDPAPFRLLETAAKNAGQSELAQAAADNLKALDDLEKQLADAILAIGSDVEDVDRRMQVARLAAELNRVPQARDWILAASRVAADRQSELLLELGKITVGAKPLVELPEDEAADDADAFSDAADSSDADDATPDEDGDGEPSDATESPGDSDTVADEKDTETDNDSE